VENGYIESLTAIYEPAGASRIRHGLASGENRLLAIFPEAIRQHIDYSGKDANMVRIFCNINTPEDLNQALAWAKQGTAEPGPQATNIAYGRHPVVDVAAKLLIEYRKSV
jgi:NDP-sugar pyrophosphorylase family protein